MQNLTYVYVWENLFDKKINKIERNDLSQTVEHFKRNVFSKWISKNTEISVLLSRKQILSKSIN